MTEKSQMGFGKYKDMKVGEVLKLITGINYLRWVYFCCSMVSFNGEILDKLNIAPEWEIKKPGKDEKKYSEYVTHFYNQKVSLTAKRKRTKTQRQKNNNSFHRDMKYFSRGNMQSRNQGH